MKGVREDPFLKSEHRAWVSGSSVCLRVPGNLAHFARSLPMAQRDKKRGVWIMPALPHIAGIIADTLGRTTTLVTDDKFDSLLAEDRADEDLDAPFPFETIFEPWDHQRRAFWFAAHRHASLLALWMGTGKTKVGIDLAIHDDAQTTLVIGPKNVVEVWDEQLTIHAPHRFIVYADVDAKLKNRYAEIERLLNDEDARPLVIALNFQVISQPPFRPPTDKRGRIRPGGLLFQWPWDFAIYDEVHQYLKNPSGFTSRALVRVKARRKLELSGTPMTHSPLDLFSEMRALDPKYFGTNYPGFRDYFAVTGGFEGRQIFRFRRLDELERRASRFMMVVDKDVLDLPPVLHLTRYGVLEPKAKRLHDKVMKGKQAITEHGEIPVPEVITRAIRAAQITSGFVVTEEEIAPDEYQTRIDDISSAKRDLLFEVLSEIDDSEPIVAFAQYRRDLATIHDVARELGRDSYELSSERRERYDWEASDGGAVLAVQIDAGDAGIDLTKACYVVFYSIGYKLGSYLQAMDRVHRPGQTRRTVYVRLVLRDTIDEVIITAMSEKRDVIAAVRDAIIDRWAA